jgi:hypothetical protein
MSQLPELIPGKIGHKGFWFQANKDPADCLAGGLRLQRNFRTD